ncbi:MAG TPA: ribosome maturation factor RimM [Acidimicrobiales bacterium]|jgi:16S rRNA processing protein RimM|nr:ribosome maturation factor RimM [Acidimicrobiales bacterium]
MTAARRSVLVVGVIGRAHGLAGAVVVRLVTDQLERLAPNSTFETDRGEMTVVAARPLNGNHVVSFRGIETREDAESYRGIELRAAPLERDDVLWVDELIGAEVRTSDGTTVGNIEAIEANPASDLLVLDTGALIPSRFVVGSLADGVVTVEVPEGLL